MRILLLFLFLAYPMLELALMIKVGSLIGVWAVLGIIMATGVLGSVIMREHGINTMRRIMAAVGDGRMPLEPVFDGALVGTAGILLIAPGLITDVLGLILLIPYTRRSIFRWAAGSLTFERQEPFGAGQPEADRGDDTGSAGPRQDRGPFGPNRRQPKDPIIIDGEFERIDERDPKNGGSSRVGRQ